MPVYLPRVARVLAFVVATLLLSVSAPGQAQSPVPATHETTAEPNPTDTIDTARSQLDSVIATLKRDGLDDAALQALRTQIDPLQNSLQEAIAHLTPRVEGAKARLAQLGPKPEANAAPEAASVSTDRDAQQKLLNELGDQLKRAKLLSVQADQISDSIVTRRREAFLKDLFHRSASLLSPTLWRDMVTDLPREGRALSQVGEDFASRASTDLDGWHLPAFLGVLAALGLVFLVIVKVARNILSREPTIADPGPLRKVLGACWTALLIAVVPIAFVMLVLTLTDAFGLFSERLAPLEHAIAGAVMHIAVAAAFARAVFAPERPNWRLIPIPTAAAERLTSLVVTLTVVISVLRTVDVLHEIVVSTLATTVFTRGLGALLFAGVLISVLYGLPAEAHENDDSKMRAEARRDWFGVVRLAGWLVALIILCAALGGYVAFAAFLADQFVWTILVGFAAFLALQVATDVVDAQARPESAIGRKLVVNVGLHRERLKQIGTLLSGVLRVIVFGTAAVLIVAPWGIQSDDLSGTLRAAYFGFAIGGVTVSPSSLVGGIILFVLGVLITRAFQGWLDERFLPTTTMDAGLRNSIRTSVGYIGFVLTLALALAQVGLSFDKLAIVAGALSVGIGFGLQSVVNNFVSGLILLWERSIRVGDWVVVGAEQGFVRRINVRSTEIETFDRAMMIVPNSTLVSGTVSNWVRSDRIGRIKIPLTVQNGSEPEKVREALISVAKANENVTRLPVPTVMFADITATGLSFELICFVNDVELSLRTKSELRFAIFEKFRDEKILIAPPDPGPTTIAFAQQTQNTLLATLQRAAAE